MSSNPGLTNAPMFDVAKPKKTKKRAEDAAESSTRAEPGSDPKPPVPKGKTALQEAKQVPGACNIGTCGCI